VGRAWVGVRPGGGREKVEIKIKVKVEDEVDFCLLI
jgi:hypothetical protein